MQHRSEETRNHILEAAQRLFSLNGYDATGVAEICLAAGVSKGAFYHHFPAKQAVFLQLLDNWLAVLDARLNSISQDASDVPHLLMRMTDIFTAVFQTAGGQLPIFLEYWLQASREEAIWQATIAPYRHYQEYFARLVQKGIDEGSFREVDPLIAAQAIVAMAVGLLLQGLLNQGGADWPQAIRQCLQLFLESLIMEVL
jgi:AcrR family transcriptional regulator